MEDVPIAGNTRWIDKIQAVFPQYVRPELSQKVIVSYPKEIFLELKIILMNIMIYFNWIKKT